MGEKERPLGAVYIDGQEVNPPYLPQLYELEAEDEKDVEAQPWPKVNPMLFLSAASACLDYIAKAAETALAAFELMCSVAKELNDKAYKAAPPRVRHLALHARKQRTRKKNARRIMRDYLKEARRH